ncbi:MAG: glycosyltransferase family 1 protein [Candidatus Eisenbacteria bacterium]|uniref:Glycosyltransferase family 1 protein n=1 Tax=Eiseniibacteriota bacterium TaxID=2212470 RepID=A0A538TVH5_UNCEI|nr:MAG: glycosyltransferase family 1 protein [Candidatus Eisenbacteria bacterium]
MGGAVRVKGDLHRAETAIMRVALFGFGTRGDVQPLIALGKRLCRDGHEVVLGASPGFRQWVEGQGLEFRSVGLEIRAWVDAHGDALSRHPARLLAMAIGFLRKDIARSFPETLEAAEGADVIASGVHGAAPSVAEALGIPHRSLLYCPQILPSREHPPMGFSATALPRPLHRISWLAARAVSGWVLKPAIDAGRRSLGLAAIRDTLDHLIGERPILACDPALAAAPRDAPPATLQTPSLVLEDATPLAPGLESFLRSGDPPICVGFGSMGDGDPEATTRLLWEAIAARRRVLVLGGWGGLGAGEHPRDVFFLPSTPHARVFPRCSLVIHHGGAGTTTAATRAGVPQIVVPHAADQVYWGQRIVQLGLGPRPIPRPRLTAARLASAISAIESHPEFAARARALAARIGNADGAIVVAAELAREAPRLRARA